MGNGDRVNDCRSLVSEVPGSGPGSVATTLSVSGYLENVFFIVVRGTHLMAWFHRTYGSY